MNPKSKYLVFAGGVTACIPLSFMFTHLAYIAPKGSSYELLSGCFSFLFAVLAAIGLLGLLVTFSDQ